MNLRILATQLGEALTVQLYTYLLAEKLLEDSVEVPFETWVQAPERWRDRLGLVFGKRRMRATGHVKIAADYYQTFPETTIKYPDGRAVGQPQTGLRSQ